MKSNKNEFLKLLTAYQGIIQSKSDIFQVGSRQGGQFSGNSLPALAVFPGVAE